MFWLLHAPAAWLLENTLISHRKTVADALRFYVDHGLIVAEQPPAMPTAERIEATASRMIAELLERAANGEALPVQGAFVLRIRALAEEIGDADSITLSAVSPSASRCSCW